MGDDTMYPASMYPGGSEEDFDKLRSELKAKEKELEAKEIERIQVCESERLTIQSVRDAAFRTLYETWDRMTLNDPRPKEPLWQHFMKQHCDAKHLTHPTVAETTLVERRVHPTCVVYICKLCGLYIHHIGECDLLHHSDMKDTSP